MKRVFSAWLFALFGVIGMASTAQAELRLAMFEQAGCAYCIMWHNEIGPIYPKTPEAAVAPLMTIDLRGPLPEGLSIKSKPVFTPTFVLLRDGVEIDRLEGYPGEDFFWGLIGKMLREQPEWEQSLIEKGGVEG
ncbi:thioredoxin family protein [Rhodovulum iodosum]|uniref:thioredoxin family protein n=1 Tax=Rhodovulum iodosum TaxID=68291 RepID=UPI001FED1764|nr:thioredoxin family protein [Rhodovulum robiginosum]